MMQADKVPDARLNWLLEPDPENPGVRYFAFRDILDRPDHDFELEQARAEIMTTGPVPAILAAQHPDGYWVKPGNSYSPKYQGTVWQIILLSELGADPRDERVHRGCEYLLGHSLSNNGAFSCNRPPVPSGSVHCLNGNLLYALIQLGYWEDPRVQTAFHWMVQSITGEGNATFYKSGTSGPKFECGINTWQPCAWGAVKALKALSAIPANQRSLEIQSAINIGVEFLFSRDPAVADYPYSERVSSAWFKFGFPLSYWSDVLENAAVLVDLGYGGDPRLAHALQFIQEKQDARGLWKLQNSLNGKMWVDIEKQGKPSKWITLRALRMLKRSGAIQA